MIEEEYNNKPESKIPDINENSKGARQWYPFDHFGTGRRYIIRYFYENEDEERECTISLESNNPQKPEEELISSFKYPAERHEQIEEAARVKALDHGNMQPPDDLFI